MTLSINYKETLFNKSNLTPIGGKPTFEMLQTSKQDQGHRKGHLPQSLNRIPGPSWPISHWCAICTHLKHDLCLPTLTRFARHPRWHKSPHEIKHTSCAHRGSVSFSQSDGSQAIPHAKNCRHSQGGKIVDIHNCTTNCVKNTIVDVITHLQENYSQLMPCELIELKDIVKKTTYHPQ